jgi:uncharacterized protein
MSFHSGARPTNIGQQGTPTPLLTGDPARLPIAPWWHTASVLIVLGVGSVASFYQHGFPNLNIPGLSVNLSGYLTVVAEEWFLVLLLWLWLKRKGLSMATLTSDRWRTPKAALRDLGFGLGFLVVGMPLIGGLSFLLRMKAASVNIFPRTPIEAGVYVVLGLTAGYCEELIFRGYLMQQFTVRANSRNLGILLQAVVFGLAHGYQGIGRMGIIVVYGCLFGAFVTWRKSLFPAMIAHGTQDTAIGLAFFFLGLK